MTYIVHGYEAPSKSWRSQPREPERPRHREQLAQGPGTAAQPQFAAESVRWRRRRQAAVVRLEQEDPTQQLEALA
eukprot:11319678-Alexandrium_andersonii.AAC.1